MSLLTIRDKADLESLSLSKLDEIHTALREEIRRRTKLVEGFHFEDGSVSVAVFQDDALHIEPITLVSDGELFAGTGPTGRGGFEPDDCDPADLLALLIAIEAKKGDR